MNKRKGFTYVIIGIIILVIVGMLAYRIHESMQPAEVENKPLSVSTMVVGETAKDEGLALTGTIEGLTSSMISSPVSGKIVALMVDDGQMVRAGEVLAKLDTVELDNSVTVANNSLHSAEAKYEQARANFARYEKLMAEGVVSSQQMDAVRTDMITAQTEVESARANVNIAKKHVSDAVITSPVSGLIANRNVTLGQNVNAASTLMTVEEINSVYATVEVPQQWMKLASMGNQAMVTVDAFPGKTFTGFIEVVNPVASADNRMFRVKIRLDNHDGLLRPGMFIHAKLAGPQGVQGLFIPQTAIIHEKGITYVFRDNHRRAEKVRVETGTIQGNTIEITRGIKSGDKIILDQLNELEDKDKITSKEVK